MAMPRPRPPAPRPARARTRARAVPGGRREDGAVPVTVTGTGSSSAGSGHPRGLLDLGDRPGLRREELVLDLAPAAQVGDREQLWWRRELACELARHRLKHRAVALLRPD